MLRRCKKFTETLVVICEVHSELHMNNEPCGLFQCQLISEQSSISLCAVHNGIFYQQIAVDSPDQLILVQYLAESWGLTNWVSKFDF